MKSQSGKLEEDKDEKYAHRWFASFCRFHNIPDIESQQWNFDEKHVLAFLRDKPNMEFVFGLDLAVPFF